MRGFAEFRLLGSHKVVFIHWDAILSVREQEGFTTIETCNSRFDVTEQISSVCVGIEVARKVDQDEQRYG